MELLAMALTLSLPCGDLPDDARTVRGKVISAERPKEARGDTIASVEIRHDQGKLVLDITKSTKLEKSNGTAIENCTVDEFVRGAVGGAAIEADYLPILFPSNPPQAQAYRIRVTVGPKSP